MPPRRRFVAIVGALLLSCASGGQGPTATQRAWLQVSTPNFQVNSSMDRETTTEVALGLERFRALIDLVLSAGSLDAPVPTEIYLFEKAYEYQDFAAHRNIAGFFHAGMRSNIATAVKTRGMDLASIMYHEYVHYVLRNATSTQYPMWYDEGFAEFLSTAFVRDDRIFVGAIPKERINSFRYHPWIGLERIVSAGRYGDFPKDDVHMLYAESWALVHYLTLQRQDGRKVGQDLGHYISLINEGQEVAPAFEEAFGMSLDSMGKAIQKELDRGRLRQLGIPLDALKLPPGEPEVRTLSQLEISIRLGQLALSVGNGVAAQRYFERATALDPDHARAQAGLGDAHKFQDRHERARPYFERSLELAPDDALTQLDYAEFLHDMAIEDEYEKQQAELLDRARAHYVKAWKLAPEIPETFAMYGSTYAPKGQDASKCLDTIQQARRLLPSNTTILDLLAACHVANDEIEKARALVDQVVTWSTHSGDREEAIEERMSELVEKYSRAGYETGAEFSDLSES